MTIALSDDEQRLVNRLEEQLVCHLQANRLHEAYYDGSFAARLLNISTPEHVQRMLKTVCGWAGTAVDVLEERLDFLGFSDEGLLDIFDANALDEEASQVHLDAMIYGISFVSVTAGRDSEPAQLIRGHDAKSTTGILNSRTRRFDSALTITESREEHTVAELWLPDQVVMIEKHFSQPWRVLDRQFHGLGMVPLVPFVNRPRTGARGGKSDITAALRRYTDAAVRTLISMDVNREFFSAPQRYAIGMDSSDFVGPDGAPMSPWQVLTGRVWTTGPVDETEREPKLGEFSPQPAGPFLEQIEGLAQLAAAEAGLPGHYFGLRGDQATSADAIRAMEARLVKRAERRQKSFGRSWSQVGRLAAAGRAGQSVDELSAVGVRWGNPATPTVAATTDAVVKQVQAGVLPTNSRVGWDRLGYTPQEQRIMLQELAQQQAVQRVSLLAGAAQADEGQPAQSDEVVAAARANRVPGGE
ncbi:hypothetical protein HMPREF2943_03030 [Corynebacterium sp. HMSC072D12]|uniref:phage portal protein n=1 Tax=Corynebacterium sp. HMSC072D12 TaxID=1739447 RepID=UPI0008A4F9A1|nr:phage portal protein [Corynebacterium sp. HMSC072D12]OFQ34002.1 hypothetical protein HMPREF2943_03030 [Corynebacterium sp. HMSC072D12]